jgi:hypothetical protein
MAMELDDILAGRACRTIEPNDERFIQQLAAIGVTKLADSGRPRLR